VGSTVSSECRCSTGLPGGETRSSVRASDSARISSACAEGSSLPPFRSSGRRASARLCTRFGSGSSRMATGLPDCGRTDARTRRDGLAHGLVRRSACGCRKFGRLADLRFWVMPSTDWVLVQARWRCASCNASVAHEVSVATDEPDAGQLEPRISATPGSADHETSRSQRRTEFRAPTGVKTRPRP
jgi:hypothetical protein